MGNFRLREHINMPPRGHSFYTIEVPVQIIGSVKARTLYVTGDGGLSSHEDDAKPFTVALEAIAYAVSVAGLTCYHQDFNYNPKNPEDRIEVAIDYEQQVVTVGRNLKRHILTLPIFRALRDVPFKLKEV